jgi:hypothetical protein
MESKGAEFHQFTAVIKIILKRIEAMKPIASLLAGRFTSLFKDGSKRSHR